MNNFIKLAYDEALYAVKNNEGGPFGAVIVRKDEIISKAHNEVIVRNDPTAHAEMLAIRIASKQLCRFDLSDCEIYTTCEPCPMCLAAIYWANIKKIYYGCTTQEASEIGFNDKYIYDVIKGSKDIKIIDSVQIERDFCKKLFDEWKSKKDKIQY